MERISVFVDVDSLNVLYNVDGCFVVALSYAGALERLGETLSSFPSGYDIYLCLKPEPKGEGDLTIPELQSGDLPFVVNTEELYSVLKFFRASAGVGSVYLCNWLDNFISLARVNTFSSAVFYGNRVALIRAENREAKSIKMFESQMAFIDELGEDCGASGDVGLIDINGLKAQYPELHTGSKAQLTAIAPLVRCDKTSVRVNTDELYDLICHKLGVDVHTEPPMIDVQSPKVGDPETQNASAAEEPEENTSVDIVGANAPINLGVDDAISQSEVEEKSSVSELGEKEIQSSEEHSNLSILDDIAEKRSVRKPIAAYFVLSVACILFMVLGVSFSAWKNTPAIEELVNVQEYETRLQKARGILEYYSDAQARTELLSKVFGLYRSFEGEAELHSYTLYDNTLTLTVSCGSEDEKEFFINHIRSQHTVSSINELGSSFEGGELSVNFSLIIPVEQ